MEHTEQDLRLIEKLKNELIHKVEGFLATEDEFIPFGILLTTDGNFRLLTISDEDDEYTTDKAIGQLKSHIDNKVTNTEILHSGGYCQDFLVNDNDAIYLNLISKSSEGWITCFIPYYIQEDRSIEYGAIILGGDEDIT